jgi:hypothetical protein
LLNLQDNAMTRLAEPLREFIGMVPGNLEQACVLPNAINRRHRGSRDLGAARRRGVGIAACAR